jgi:AcrR family transcriptional regulator
MAAGKGRIVPSGKTRAGLPEQPRPKRAIGRPAASGNSVGREKLLKTACDLLKTTPPGQLTRLMVAQKANVDPSLIRYYFRDRATLLAAAAEQLSAQYAERMDAKLRQAKSSAREQLQQRLELNVNLDVVYAHFRRLLLDELMASPAPQARAAATKITLRGAETYRAIVAAGVADGSLRQDDPVMLFIAVVALSSYFPAAKTVYEIATGQRIGQKAMAEQYSRFVTTLVSRGMAAEPAASALPADGADRPIARRRAPKAAKPAPAA